MSVGVMKDYKLKLRNLRPHIDWVRRVYYESTSPPFFPFLCLNTKGESLWNKM